MQPQPLLRMFAHPPFDHIGDRLRRGLDVDLAVGAAHWRDLVGQLGPEVIAVWQAYRARAADWGAGEPRELRDQRVSPGPAAEENHVDTLRGVLVDQHGDVLAAFEGTAELERRVESGRHHVAHAARAHRYDRVARTPDVRTAVEDGDRKSERVRPKRRYFPVGEMRGEHKAWSGPVAEQLGARVSDVIDHHIGIAASLRMRGVVIDDPIDVCEFG